MKKSVLFILIKLNFCLSGNVPKSYGLTTKVYFMDVFLLLSQELMAFMGKSDIVMILYW